MVACPAEARLTSDGLTATTDSYEPRVLLGSVGFSRGVHYWEVTVERYDGTADPAFGVARRDVSRGSMLGTLSAEFCESASAFAIQISYYVDSIRQR